MIKIRFALVLRITAFIVVVFGILTILSGGRALFGGPEAQIAVGNAVPFVLWFNFGAGFFYIISGIGLALRKKWAVWLAATIALATILVFAAFGMHILTNGAYEMRTVGAMTLRTLVWVGVTVIGFQANFSERRNRI